MATITIYLTYQAPNLMWRNSESDQWQVMEETSKTAKTTAGDTVVWVIDNTIKKIKDISVGKSSKIDSGYKWKDIWSKKPKKDSDTQYSGVVSTSMYRGDADGYDITVKLADNTDLTVDPDVVVEEPEKP
ncbi:MAG: hypothetical protein RLO81_04775 [Fulvivirga sp.]|uniref:hypothetical protein n=1 Tax=Fulvivirga sp. TaxID=1931237 RepID=UPI0032ED3B33